MGSVHRNEVALVGRLAAPAEERTLPSGDALLSFRVIVERPAGSPGPRVDTLDCAAWTAGVQRKVGAWGAGDVVEVTGALRRRFWRTPGGPASRTEVDVRSARRVSGARG